MNGVAVCLVFVLLVGCRPGAVVPRDEGLAVSELSVEFPDDGAGELWFAVDCPLDVGAKVTTLRWELWLSSHRFAAGVEEPEVKTVGDRLVRVAVHAPLRYRHVRFEPGNSYVTVGVSGELVISKRGVDAPVQFRGSKEVLARGVPVLEDVRE